MARVYLETSFISACVSTRTDAASQYRRETSMDWMRLFAASHELFVSIEVLTELGHPSHPQRDAALRIAEGLDLLGITAEVGGLATMLVRERVMPGPVSGDAVHVAACCVHRVEFLLSWNVRHLANQRKVAHLQAICLRAGYAPPRIVTPDLLWGTGA